jgi:murein DD-endopeptidase MepM/ murein hydrolase activator NlpD
LVTSLRADEHRRSAEFVRDNINAMAVRLGQMQAELIRLNSLGERLGASVGLKPAENKPGAAPRPGQGGPLNEPAFNLTPAQLQQKVEELSRQIGLKDAYFNELEAEVFEQRLKQARLPSTLPVPVNWNSSSFGWRIDPFTGQQALHEGVDFMADEGTPIVAAAAGRVIQASFHPQYGNLVEIDHGFGITTRYAHAAQVHTRVGDLVRRGQKIATVGSTGRSTGPHLHFEVRTGGVAQNPDRFLRRAQGGGLAAR